ncbi:MAG TPA: extracellular solute-binding protein [Baekduia sp.]|uniref:ABC transporter substrate-binding protein n=1 Tax=Baekduia sp. TaxID=2600305 RepID=UPI002D779CC2|nr:extracellular solute-binding protein [Baekduia sp.]HET6507990.1 extracellular solute-binding protein [Baekduia sp.]
MVNISKGGGYSRRQVLARGSAAAGTAVVGSFLAACGGNDSKSTASGAKKAAGPAKVNLNKTVDITLWTWAWPAPDAGAKTFVAAFEKAEPMVKLKVKQYPYPDYVTALRTGIPNGTAGEVLHLETGSMLRQYAKFLSPIEERVKADWGASWESEFADGSVTEIRQSTQDGKTLYALPQQASVGGFVWYNKKLFEKAGVEVPKSYEDLKTISAALRGKGTIPMAWGAKDQWPNTDWLIAFASQYKPGVVDAAERGKTKFTDEAIVNALKFMKQSLSDGIWNKAPFATTAFPEAYGTFTGGKSAMTSNGTWGLNLFKPKDLKNFGVFLFPQITGVPDSGKLGSAKTGAPVDSGPGGALPWKTDNLTVGVRSGLSKDKAEAAYRFARYWCGEEGQKVGAQTFTPVRKDVANPLVTPEFQEQYDFMNSLAGVAEPRQFQFTETRTALQDAIANVCVKGADAQSELAKVDTAVQRARRRA